MRSKLRIDWNWFQLFTSFGVRSNSTLILHSVYKVLLQVLLFGLLELTPNLKVRSLLTSYQLLSYLGLITRKIIWINTMILWNINGISSKTTLTNWTLTSHMCLHQLIKSFMCLKHLESNQTWQSLDNHHHSNPHFLIISNQTIITQNFYTHHVSQH